MGPTGLTARRRVNQALSDFIVEVVNRPHEGRQHPPLSDALAMSIVGGINELVLQRVEQDRIGELTDLADTTARFVRAVVYGAR